MAWCVSLSELTEDNNADWAGWELGRDGEDLRCWQVGRRMGVFIFGRLGWVIWGRVVRSEG